MSKGHSLSFLCPYAWAFLASAHRDSWYPCVGIVGIYASGFLVPVHGVYCYPCFPVRRLPLLRRLHRAGAVEASVRLYLQGLREDIALDNRCRLEGQSA